MKGLYPPSAERGSWTDQLVADNLGPRDDRYEPVEILGSFNRDQFLDTLNRSRDSPGETLKLPFDDARLRRADVAYDAQLRMYVDEWLDTGVDANGEDPRKRDLTKAPNACAAVRRFAGKHTLQLATAHTRLNLRLPSVHKGLSFELPPPPPTDKPDQYFSLFFLCAWRARLAKCRRCGLYFELNHWKRAYKRGILCPVCRRWRSLESAVRSTKKARETAETELYRLAARRFGNRLRKTADWHLGRQFKTTVIDFLNSQIKGRDSLTSIYPHGVTEKWLSWLKNRNGINKAAKGETHAEG